MRTLYRVAALSLALSLAACADRESAHIIPQHSHEHASIARFGSFYSDEQRRAIKSVIRSELIRAKRGIAQ